MKNNIYFAHKVIYENINLIYAMKNCAACHTYREMCRKMF